MASFYNYGPQNFDLVDKYCKIWNLRYNMEKFGIMIFKGTGKLMATNKWKIIRREFDLVGNCFHL